MQKLVAYILICTEYALHGPWLKQTYCNLKTIIYPSKISAR